MLLFALTGRIPLTLHQGWSQGIPEKLLGIDRATAETARKGDNIPYNHRIDGLISKEVEPLLVLIRENGNEVVQPQKVGTSQTTCSF